MDMNVFMEKMKDYGMDIDGVMDRFMDDVELYYDCLLSFIADERFNTLGLALIDKNHKMAFEAAHTLKGVASNLGLSPMLESLCQIVEPLRQQSPGDFTPQYREILQQLARLEELVQH